MIICETFDEAFLTLIQLIATGDYKTVSLIFIERRNEWLVGGDGFTFDERTLPGCTCELKAIKTLMKIKEVGEIKDIALTYDDIVGEYNHKITIII